MGCMALHPNGVYRAPCKKFRNDALLTLGRYMMDAQCWNGSDIVLGKVLRYSSDNPDHVWM